MAFLPQQLTEQLVKSGIKKGASLNVYDASIRKIYNEVFSIKQFNPSYLMEEYKKINEWIDTTCKVHNKSARVAHCIKVLQALPDSEVALEAFREFKSKCQAIASQKMPEDKKMPDITYSKMDAILDNLTSECKKENTSVDSYIKWRIMVLFCSPEFPTMRGQELCEMEMENDIKVIEENKEKNYCSLEHKKFFIRNHKTSKQYNKDGIDIPENIMCVLKETAKKIDSKWLIPKLSDISKNQDRHNLKYAFKSILGESVSIQILRRMFHSYAQDTGRSKEDFEKHCYIMGHSCGTAYKNYLSAYSQTLFTPKKQPEPEPELEIKIQPAEIILEDIVPQQKDTTKLTDMQDEINKLRKIISLQSNTIKEQQEIISLLSKSHNE